MCSYWWREYLCIRTRSAFLADFVPMLNNKHCGVSQKSQKHNWSEWFWPHLKCAVTCIVPCITDYSVNLIDCISWLSLSLFMHVCWVCVCVCARVRVCVSLFLWNPQVVHAARSVSLRCVQHHRDPLTLSCLCNCNIIPDTVALLVGVVKAGEWRWRWRGSGWR